MSITAQALKALSLVGCAKFICYTAQAHVLLEGGFIYEKN